MILRQENANRYIHFAICPVGMHCRDRRCQYRQVLDLGSLLTALNVNASLALVKTKSKRCKKRYSRWIQTRASQTSTERPTELTRTQQIFEEIERRRTSEKQGISQTMRAFAATTIEMHQSVRFNLGRHAAQGAGGGTTYKALKGADAGWEKVRNMQASASLLQAKTLHSLEAIPFHFTRV